MTSRKCTTAVGGTSLAGYTYDGNGNVVSKTLSDGRLASYTYDAANRLTTLNHTLSGTSFARFDYGYDSVNRRTYERRDTAAGDVFGYDAVDQVASVNYDATNPTSGTTGADRTVGYTYDANGNRTAVNDNVNGNASYSANNLNEYTSVGVASYASDANGNLISGSGLYAYDAQNRLTTAATSIIGGNVDQLSYDSKNRVVERTVNGTPLYLVYDGWDLIEERDATNTVLNTYVHGVKQDEILTKTNSSGTVYYHQNALGSVTDLTNSSGVVVEKYKYDVYGKPAIYNASGTLITASAYGNRFLFTAREFLSEVNLYDYRNRVYSADLGRFLQTDPMRFAAGDVNIYRYCGNDPLNAYDPTGMWEVTVTLGGGYAGSINFGVNGGSVNAGFTAGVGEGASITYNPNNNNEENDDSVTVGASADAGVGSGLSAGVSSSAGANFGENGEGTPTVSVSVDADASSSSANVGVGSQISASSNGTSSTGTSASISFGESAIAGFSVNIAQPLPPVPTPDPIPDPTPTPDPTPSQTPASDSTQSQTPTSNPPPTPTLTTAKTCGVS